MKHATTYLTGLILAGSSCVYGQATDNAVTEAEDAFGFTNGEESVGIYNASSVRGFSLESAGNYRVNGRYFVKSSGVSSMFLEETTVRIGYNTLGTDLPGPSGVVDYRLRDPERGEPGLLTAGLGVYGTPYLEALFKHRDTNNKFSVAGGLSIRGDGGTAQGGREQSWLVAGTARYNFSPQSKLQLFGGEYDYEYHGDFVVRTDGTFLPERIERQKLITQKAAKNKGQRRIAGALFDQQLSRSWDMKAIAVFSQDDPNTAFTQVMSLDDPSAPAQSRLIVSPAQRFTAWSGEIKLGYSRNSGNLHQKVTLLARGRKTRNHFGGEQIVSLPDIILGDTPTQIMLPPKATASLTDHINQWGVGVSYHMIWAKKIKLAAGLLKSDYQKSFIFPQICAAESGVDCAFTAEEKNSTQPWLYNIAVSAKVAKGLELYGSYSRGLEEAGTAPTNAANPNAVLPAVIATQRELGIKARLSPSLKLIFAGFDTRKPYAALDTQSNIYGLFNNVRHRGIEASLSGELAQGLSVVLGGVWTEARLSGETVEAGLTGPRPVGVPTVRFIANANYSLPSIPALSLDAGVEYIGHQSASSRLVDGRQLTIPSNIKLDLGLRYRLKLGNQDATFRVHMANVLNDFTWTVGSAETFTYNEPRRLRLLLTTEF